MNCDPYVEDINALIKDLNKTNGLFKFVRIMREIASCCSDVLDTCIRDGITLECSCFLLKDSRSETLMKENVPHLQPTDARLRSRHTLIHGQVAAPSPQSILTLCSFLCLMIP